MMYEEKQKQLQQLGELLTTRLNKVERDLSMLHSSDSAEQVTERENEDVLRNLAAETRLELQQVHHALRRIESGEYGVCSQCGEDISPQRLEALPYATLCVRCADR